MLFKFTYDFVHIITHLFGNYLDLLDKIIFQSQP